MRRARRTLLHPVRSARRRRQGTLRPPREDNIDNTTGHRMHRSATARRIRSHNHCQQNTLGKETHTQQ